MMTKEKYIVNDGVYTYQSLSHKVIFTQMNANKGIKPFGERATVAMFKEYKKLYDVPIPGKPVVVPFNPYGVTPLYGKKTLEVVNLITDKNCGNIKVRTFSNGIKQRKYLRPDKIVHSSTCSTKALIATLVIDAMEQRDVAIFNVPGDFLQTALPSDKFLLLRFRDEFVDVIC